MFSFHFLAAEPAHPSESYFCLQAVEEGATPTIFPMAKSAQFRERITIKGFKAVLWPLHGPGALSLFTVMWGKLRQSRDWLLSW